MNKLDKLLILLLYLIGISLITIGCLMPVPYKPINYEPVDLSRINMYDINEETMFYSHNDNNYKTILGVDLSEHNQDVDFKLLKDQGIKYIFLRVGWRGYVNPEIHLDKKFEEYYAKAIQEDFPIGVYFFSQAINEEEAIEEANFLYEQIKDKTIALYTVYDYESAGEENGRIYHLTKEQRTNNAIAFVTKMQEYGYKPMIYTNLDWAKNYYDMFKLSEYPIWFAQYAKIPKLRTPYIIWQYSTNNIIKGVSSENGVDLNLLLVKEEAN